MSSEDPRIWISPKTKVPYYLCAWSTGCNMPVRTNPEGDPLCRWHTECARVAHAAHDRALFETWLADMQTAYPSRGWWGWSADRLWPILRGQVTV